VSLANTYLDQVTVRNGRHIKVTYTVDGLPLPDPVRAQPGNNNNVCDEGLESLTPLHKGIETLWPGEPVVKTELSAVNMVPLFTNQRLEAVMLKVNIWVSSCHCVYVGRHDLV
jgi:hypothetical protein